LVITVPASGEEYEINVRSHNDRGYSDATLAVPTCEDDIEDCVAHPVGYPDLIVPRGLPAAPAMVSLSAPGRANAFGSDELIVSWLTGTTLGVDNTKYKVEWDTVSSFDSRSDGKPLSFSSASGTSPEVFVAADPSQEFFYPITGLQRGVQYYVRISAANTLGYGGTAGPFSSKPFEVSSEPTHVMLSALPSSSSAYERGTSAVVSFEAPISDGGDDIDSFFVEWSTEAFDAADALTAYTYDVQTITTSVTAGGSLDGYIRVSLDTSASQCPKCAVQGEFQSARIPAVATAADLQRILENMPNTGDIEVSAVGPNTGNTMVWTVTFKTLPGALPLFDVDDSELVAVGGGTASAASAKVTNGVSPADHCGGSSTCATLSGADLATTPHTHVISGLSPGVQYYVRVSAANSIGFGPVRVSTPLHITPPKQPPSPPTSPFSVAGVPILRQVSPTMLRVSYGHPAFDGGDPVVKYRIEWDPSPFFNSSGAPGENVPYGFAEVPAPTPDNLLPQEYTIAIPPNDIPTLPDGGRLVVDAVDPVLSTMPLTTGTKYYVRVFAYNSALRYGEPALATPSSEVPRGAPEAPAQVQLSALDEHTLRVTWTPDISNGAPITQYKVEQFVYDPVAPHFGRPEVHVVELKDSTGSLAALDGTFSLAYGYGVDEKLPGTVTVVNKQVVRTAAPGSSLDGTFTLSFDTTSCADCAIQAVETTDALPHDVSVGAMENALERLSNLGDVTVSRNTADAATAGNNAYVWTITFTADAFTSPTSAVPTLTVDDTSLTGTGAAATVDHTTVVLTSEDLTAHIERCDRINVGSMKFTVHADPAFTFSSEEVPLAEPTDCHVGKRYPRRSIDAIDAFKRPQTIALSPHDTAEFIEAALENLPTVGDVEVTRTTTADAVAFSVTFVSDVNPNTNIASDILAPGTLHHLPLLQLNDHLMGATYDDVNSAVARDDGLTPTRYAATIVDHVAGASLQMADLRGLDTGVAYYVRVSAANDRGYGSYQVSNPPSLAPVAAPGSVAAVRLLPHTETSVVVEYDEIADENGADILSYKVEWAGASSF
jgi:hypothetical protein